MRRWFSRHAKLASAALAATYFVAAIAIAVIARGQPRPAQATVVRVAAVPELGLIKVTAQTAEGYVGSRTVAAQKLQCAVGDTVNVDVKGASVIISDQSCGSNP